MGHTRRLVLLGLSAFGVQPLIVLEQWSLRSHCMTVSVGHASGIWQVMATHLSCVILFGRQSPGA